MTSRDRVQIVGAAVRQTDDFGNEQVLLSLSSPTPVARNAGPPPRARQDQIIGGGQSTMTVPPNGLKKTTIKRKVVTSHGDIGGPDLEAGLPIHASSTDDIRKPDYQMPPKGLEAAEIVIWVLVCFAATSAYALLLLIPSEGTIPKVIAGVFVAIAEVYFIFAMVVYRHAGFLFTGGTIQGKLTAGAAIFALAANAALLVALYCQLQQ
jgi:hypothetical protein